MKRPSQTTLILLGLALGAAAGLLLARIDPSRAVAVAGLLQPVGRLWLNALQMTVVPLVTALIVVGINKGQAAASPAAQGGPLPPEQESAAAPAAHAESELAASARTARRALVVFFVLLAAGAAFTATVAPLLLSLLPRDAESLAALRAAFAPMAAAPASPSLGDWIANVVPSNALAAAAQNAMLPLVVFALFFGFALTRIDAPRRARMVEFFQTIADAMIVIVRWVLRAAPLGVFALVFGACAHAGSGLLSALAAYIALQCSTYAAVTLLLYPAVAVFGSEPLRRFAAGIVPAQAVAASTQSSLASLPAMIDCARTRLGHPTASVALVLPMAVSLFRITSPMQYLGAAAFVAWIYGVDVPLAQVGAAAALAVVLSLGAVGLPGQVSFMAATMPVTSTMGLPIEPLGLLLAVDTIPDVFATVGNVSADLAASSIVARAGASDAATADPG